MNFRKFRWLAGFAIAAVLLSSCNVGATPPPAQDVGAIQTQAFSLVLTQAADQATQTAAAVPPTPIPTNTIAPTNTVAVSTTDPFGIPTNTPFTFNTQQPGFTPQTGLLGTPTGTPGAYSTITTSNGCNWGEYVDESGPYDGKTILIGEEFVKSWEFINKGTCTWDEGYQFSFVEGVGNCNGPKYVVPKDYVIPKDGPFTKPGEYRTFSVLLRAPNQPGEYMWCFKMKDDAGQYFGSLVTTKIIAVLK